MLAINHTEAEGTVIEGTRKGDGTADVLKAYKWRWSRTLGAWYIPRSRDVAPKLATINGTADALRAAGFDVELSIESGVRDQTEVEADRAARQAARVEALENKAGRRAADAEAAETKAHDLSGRYPMGQPILVGHHSEARHRRDIARTQAASTAAAEAHRAAERAKAKADAAKGTTDSRYSPAVVARRIDRLEADLRKAQRARDGHSRVLFVHKDGTPEREIHEPATGAYLASLEDSIERLESEVQYWHDVREAQEAAGQKLYTRADIKRGYLVKVSGQWWKVVRVNAKSVSVETGYSWTDTVKYDAISSALDPETQETISPGSAAA
ncbi:DUF3560 domain-containing protein (plasmid) [Rhodococcus sp. ZPP]|uniref:DUF3560 domain-containing protein n=1 Tax=Rhodococcus sp. ZPP TaxID=2749906 RepID=UPI001AD89682|nr:DUF3560 domain-containing protein [Rhodococcus sp. ZPP]QTJ71417.1 DUF3560 domain-containing protein [Rhodococcus sp. ZPP]